MIFEPTVSLCMIVRDSGKVLRDCLESVRPFVDEIIIVDTGSTDDSREIALGFGSNVLEYKWHDDFAAARNIGLARASSDYLMMMDHDDVLVAKDVAGTIKSELLKHPDADAIRLRIAQAQKGNFRSIRIWKNGLGITYRRAMHEFLAGPEGKPIAATRSVANSDLTIEHRHVTADDDIALKAERNIRILEKAIAADPNDTDLLFYLGTELNAQGKFEQALDKFLSVFNNYSHLTPDEQRSYKYSVLPSNYAQLVATLGMLNRVREAGLYYERAVRAFPEHRDIHYLMAVILGSIGDLRNARILYSRGLAKLPGYDDLDSQSDIEVRCLCGSADVANATGSPDEARSFLQQALEIDPVYEPAIRTYVQIFRTQGAAQLRKELQDISKVPLDRLDALIAESLRTR